MSAEEKPVVTPEVIGSVLLAFVRALSPRVGQLASGTVAGDLMDSLGAGQGNDAAAELERIDPEAWRDQDELVTAHTRVFVRNKVPPYETTYMAPSIIGHGAELADIAGFYKAFGFEVSGDRPDHLLAEIEFAAFLAVKEIEARAQGNAEGEEICESARITFLREHLGCWVDAFADRLADEQPSNPYVPLVMALARYLDFLCGQLGIDPQRPVNLPGAPLLDIDNDDDPHGCMGCPAEADEIQIPG